MKDENSPVSADEVVIRLIWTDFYKPGLPVSVSAKAFLPRPNDPEGISVYRLACVSDAKDVLVVMAPEKRDKYWLALLPVAELTSIGLTVQPDKIDMIAGHAVIPEMNSTLAMHDSDACLELQKKIAIIAARNVIPSDA